MKQRKEYKLGQLSEDQITRLEDIGFVWCPSAIQWDLMYEKLKEYKAKVSFYVQVLFSFILLYYK